MFTTLEKNGSETILIVDDQPINLDILSKTLINAGFRVTVAIDGESAIEQANYSPPALLLLDVKLPDIDGFETCRRLKANARTEHIPIIFMTALDEPEHKVRGFSLGAVDYITKPFQPEEVLARVRTHLQMQNLSQILEEQNRLLREEITARAAAENALRQVNRELQQEIRDRILAEEALKQYRNQLEDLVGLRTAELTAVNRQLKSTLAELAHRAEELTRSNAELEEVAYIASHDLQEPLRMVASYTQLLARRYEGQLDAKADKYIHYAVDGAHRMQILINDLLDYSRVGRNGKDFEAIDMEQVLAQAIANLQVTIRESQAAITFGELPIVRGDRSELVRLFQNLLSNAMKYYSEAYPKITIEAVAQDGTWRFAVQDNGIGIDPKHKDRIFFIFQRLHHREEYPGSGIGLAICKKIVEHHGGQIGLESELGQGSTFWFTIPKGLSQTQHGS
jgi:signal transduction histidine kinase